jgi:hypothetical protein
VHFVDESNDVKDFDVWFLDAQHEQLAPPGSVARNAPRTVF